MDEQIAIAYRHDAHKMRGRSHGHTPRVIRDVTVNESVPYGADKDAAALSRPSGKRKHTLPNHETHYRRSVITGGTAYDPDSFSLRYYQDELESLLSNGDSEAMHRAWLASDVVNAFNEDVFYPYTSLKYHTLLVVALVSNYRENHEFDDLYLVLSNNERHTHRTVFDSRLIVGESDLPHVTLSVLPNEDKGAKVSSYPWLNWSSVWSRLPQHPESTSREYMVLDAQLRRITSWSTALQYIEDVYTRGVA